MLLTRRYRSAKEISYARRALSTRRLDLNKLEWEWTSVKDPVLWFVKLFITRNERNKEKRKFRLSAFNKTSEVVLWNKTVASADFQAQGFFNLEKKGEKARQVCQAASRLLECTAPTPFYLLPRCNFRRARSISLSSNAANDQLAPGSNRSTRGRDGRSFGVNRRSIVPCFARIFALSTRNFSQNSSRAIQKSTNGPVSKIEDETSFSSCVSTEICANF